MNEPNNLKEQVFDYEKKATEYLEVMGMNTQLSQSQKKQFIELASACQLNPFKREIYPIIYKNRFGGNEISLVTGYEVYIQRANQSGLLDGWTWETEGEIKYKTELKNTKEGKSFQLRTIDKSLSNLKAIVTIYRKDWSHPFVHSITIDEFSGESAIWLQSPKFMLKKTCASQAFRLCFSKELSGIPYTTEETSTFKNVNDISGSDEIKQPLNEEVSEPKPTEIKSNNDNEQSLPDKIIQQAETLYSHQFLTERKKDSIIEKANDPETKEGLLKYLDHQTGLLLKLHDLTSSGLISDEHKISLYKAILSAKNNELTELDKTLKSFECNQEVA